MFEGVSLWNAKCDKNNVNNSIIKGKNKNRLFLKNRFLRSKNRFSEIEYRSSIFTDRTSKIDLVNSSFKNRFAKSEFQYSIFTDRTSKIDLVNSSFKNRFAKSEFQYSIFKHRKLKIDFQNYPF